MNHISTRDQARKERNRRAIEAVVDKMEETGHGQIIIEYCNKQIKQVDYTLRWRPGDEGVGA